VKEEPVNANQDALKGLEQGFREVKMIQNGKMKDTPLNEFLDELQCRTY
jgi:hypothetical protein